eukprot:TRINITY_DN29168_c0_g1_i1.p1 TRINITY_DN29168_c0_g1~~TRINITY_DN29168_c0_g1_i1.p1  ORF type:complete len:586 (-),score=138.06 TRINITY_DN29168_c0_g1_i1:235-1992(-)
MSGASQGGVLAIGVTDRRELRAPIVENAASATPGSDVEIESGGVPPQRTGSRNDCHSKVFPFRLCTCCPCLPDTLTKIQDWLHLVLIAGVITSIVCMCQMIGEIAFSDSCDSLLCFKQIISGIFVLPSTAYFMKTIGSYDQRLEEKKRAHADQVRQLLQQAEEQQQAMNEMCANFTDSANTFASETFNERRDNFLEYLEGLKLRFQDLYMTPDMMEQLRVFILRWLQMFSAAALTSDREHHPLLAGAEQALAKCTTPQQLCDEAIRRAEFVDTNYQVDRESAVIFRLERQQALLQESDQGKCGITWLQLGRWRGCYARGNQSSPDRLPWVCACGIFKLRILSKTHCIMLMAFFLDIGMFLYELVEIRFVSLLLVIINEICVVSLLACFEQIDEIAKLEKAISACEEENAKISKRRDAVKEKWEKVQQMHELWKYRSLPCLQIMGRVHREIEAQDRAIRDATREQRAQITDDRRELLELANQSLFALDRKLGTIEEWTNPNGKKKEWKETVGRQLQQARTKAPALQDVLIALPLATNSSYLANVDDLPSSRSPMPSPRPSPRPGSTPQVSPPTSSRSSPSSSFVGR